MPPNGPVSFFFSQTKTSFFRGTCCSARDEGLSASSDTDSTLDHVALLPQSAPVEYYHSDSALHHPGRGGKRKRSATAGIMSPRLLRHPLRNELYWTSSLQRPRPLSWQGWKLCVLGQVDRPTLQHFSTLCARCSALCSVKTTPHQEHKRSGSCERQKITVLTFIGSAAK